MAPAQATRDMFLDEKGNAVAERSRMGPLAAGVPGAVAGLLHAHKQYGRLPLAKVIAPAIALARDGFDVSWEMAKSFEAASGKLSKFPASVAAFFGADGVPPAEGERLVQPDLAKTLTLISRGGADAFYRGPIADLIAREMERSGGLITRSDLAAYVAQRAGTGHRHVPRLRDRVDAAAEFRRRRACRTAEHPRRISRSRPTVRTRLERST